MSDPSQFRLPDQYPPLTASGALPTSLFWALVASTVVHSALVAMPRVLPNHPPSAMADPGVTLQASLVAPKDKHADQIADHQAELAVAAVSSPMQPAAQDVSVPALPFASAVPRTPSAPPPLLAVGGATDVRIDGRSLEDRNRLGELLSRQMTEFPVEVDFPARVNEKIRARYPPAALAAGREDSVAVWIVVDAQGAPEEILVADGAEEFADAVVAAVKHARFVPAQNNLVPIRYPLALEFHFTVGPEAVAGAAAAPQ